MKLTRMAHIMLCMVLLAAAVTVSSEQISGDVLDQMNVLDSSRAIGAGIVQNLVEGVQESLPFVEQMLSEKPSDELCNYEATTEVMGMKSKKERLISCLLKDVSPDDDESTVRDKIISAATDIVATIPADEEECPVEELEKITLEMSTSDPRYVECVTKLVFKAIANLGELGAYDEIENEENELSEV